MLFRHAISRRHFLKGSAVAVALPWVVPENVFRKAHAAPSERIAVGLIGPGKQGRGYHLRTLSGKADVEMLAICEVDTTRRESGLEEIQKRYSKDHRTCSCKPYHDFREVIARKDIDAVCIATPDHWHAIPAILAAQAEKHIYCEKPLSVSLLEARRVVEAAREHKICFQVGSQQRSNVFGPFCEAVDIIRSGRLGKISKVHVTVGGPPKWQCDLAEEPMEPGLDWDLWLGPAPKRPYSSVLSPRGVHNHFPAWRNYFEYASGGHGDMGAHYYDIALWALQRDRTGPAEILPPEEPQADDGVRFVYPDGLEIVHGRDQTGCVFYGENGVLHIQRGKLDSNPESITKEPLPESAAKVLRVPNRDHHQNWLDAIRQRKDPVAPVEAGAAAAMLIHLGNLAYRYRQTLRWDPVGWQFLGGTGNPAWLDRPRRDPWQLPEV